jgi:hypothetical protein
MLKDINEEYTEGVCVAVIHELNDLQNLVWNVYAINYTPHFLEGVLVSSKGYGTVNGEEKKTSALRHFLNTIEPLSYVKIEPLPEDLFILNNEYWMSYYVDGKIQERKYVFGSNSIREESLEKIGLINMPGLLLQ